MTATASTATARKRADLPSKEASILKAVMKFYENKQYKKGMKSCDQILRKCPEHGETLSMKALFLSYLERKDEAHELIKKAVRLEITNAVCWHVYGLIHRAEKNYEEAVKCYAQAMRLDKENVQMFRDNAMLQIHIRNYEAFVVSFQPRLRVVKAYWISLAVSYHVVRNYDAALEVLQHYFDMFMTYVEPNVEYENSEFYLYRTQVLSDAGRHQDALDYLTKYEKKILDKKGMKEARALDEEKTSRIFELFEDLADQFGRSNAIRRVPLNYATGERFARRIDSYMRPMFRKGVPSLFVSIKALYGDSSRMEAVESLVTGYESSLRANSSFEANASESTDGDLPDLEPPSALLWVLYYLAQHFDYRKDYARAFKYIEEAIKHTPTIVELYMTKAKIFKHVGDLQSAMETMDLARKLDFQDRFINSKCAKYMLRNDCVEDAEKTAALFCKPDLADKMKDIVDMQTTWYEYECALSHVRTGAFGRALKRFHEIEKNFFDYFDDQFDFHNYNMRKMTVRAYLDLLRMEDRLKSHPFYFNAAVAAVRLYVQLLDKPSVEERERTAGGLNDLSESERRKAMRKARKAELASAGAANGNAVAAPVPASASASGHGSNALNNAKKKVDEDPDGLKLLDPAVLVSDCMKFLRPLLELSPGRIESQVLGAHVYIRKKNYLLALKCLKNAYRIDSVNPELHLAAVRFLSEVSSPAATTNAAVRAVLDSETAQLFPGHSGDAAAAQFNEAYAARHVRSLAQLVAAAEAAVALFAVAPVPGSTTRAAFLEESRRRVVRANVLNAVLAGPAAWSGVSLKVAVDALAAIGSVGRLGASDTGVAAAERAEFAAKCREAFPYATAFRAEQ
ncbi:hypothetical protein HK405_009547 [Cladochytrium tenue]|nr:hypothetical protein HK405_009547 [Cladochytrium tenue]